MKLNRLFPFVLALCLWLGGNVLLMNASGQGTQGNGKKCQSYLKKTESTSCSTSNPCHGICKNYEVTLGRCIRDLR